MVFFLLHLCTDSLSGKHFEGLCLITSHICFTTSPDFSYFCQIFECLIFQLNFAASRIISPRILISWGIPSFQMSCTSIFSQRWQYNDKKMFVQQITHFLKFSRYNFSGFQFHTFNHSSISFIKCKISLFC